ncbi:MAG TPA: nickel-dependent lactate racemase [Bacteroidota bacterium]|nr:nickel-dependent lactate racemase [Bacteroidota bacterium]
MPAVSFPYPAVPSLEIPDRNFMGVFAPPGAGSPRPEEEILASALSSPIGVPALSGALKGKRSVLIVSDDHHRPTPVRRMLPPVLAAIAAAGIPESAVEIIMALGSHRQMTRDEIREKLGDGVAGRFRVTNHEWTNPDNLYFAGRVPPGIDVWVNRKMREFDFIVGLGQIMPMDVCGFTGGCNIIIPGLCGPKTSADFHWVRVGLRSEEVVGKRDNPIRAAIDNAALAAGLDAIFNVVLDGGGRICSAVYGHPVEAHRRGIAHALEAHTVTLPARADIVVADGFPFDIEFWQVNKALDNAALAVRDGGVVIVVSPCTEGLSVTHGDVIRRVGYRPKREIVELVEAGAFTHRVAAVHMIQVAEATFERDVQCILVTDGISADELRDVHLAHAPDPQSALEAAFRRTGTGARVAVLRRASETLPLIQER